MSDYRVGVDVDFNEVNDRVRAEIRRTVNALTLLRGSVSSKVEEGNDWIEGTVGAGGALVPYAFAHEFGLKGSLAIKAHLRTIKKAFGQPITPRQVMIKAHSRSVNMRERRFMRDSLDEISKIVPRNIDAAIERGLSGG